MKEEASALENRWMIGVASIVGALSGLGVAIWSKPEFLGFIKEYGALLGLGVFIASIVVLILIARQK